MDENALIVLNFETTGLSPKHGDRAIEIGAVRLEQNLIVDRFFKNVVEQKGRESI